MISGTVVDRGVKIAGNSNADRSKVAFHPPLLRLDSRDEVAIGIDDTPRQIETSFQTSNLHDGLECKRPIQI